MASIGESETKGSARSIKEFHVTEALDACANCHPANNYAVTDCQTCHAAREGGEEGEGGEGGGEEHDDD